MSQDDEIHYSEFLAAMMASRIALHDELLKDAFRPDGCTGSRVLEHTALLDHPPKPSAEIVSEHFLHTFATCESMCEAYRALAVLSRILKLEG